MNGNDAIQGGDGEGTRHAAWCKQRTAINVLYKAADEADAVTAQAIRAAIPCLHDVADWLAPEDR